MRSVRTVLGVNDSMKPVLYRRADPEHYWWAKGIAYATLALLILALAGGGAALFYGLWRWFHWIAYGTLLVALLLATGIGFAIVWFAWFAHGQPK